MHAESTEGLFDLFFLLLREADASTETGQDQRKEPFLNEHDFSLHRNALESKLRPRDRLTTIIERRNGMITSLDECFECFECFERIRRTPAVHRPLRGPPIS
jgi:hypothetical protein